ncbi:TRAP transporter small permease [Litorihabitans aurantiacus]|uniref:Tripartite ATP-independent periplasmic transporters DctQ component domain-containing protein n=1 Tax=Litorihabitans aurantiacus TaxID=1930061 RepID=A0AA37XHI0_9MICO|nr:TRAP transporter small permease [Litorihabitans aurantiacus]GMA33390.1 hypothetical protein GCM10025875_33820 [Litorihabitans aurantiacus]
MDSVKKALDRALYWIVVVLFAMLVLIVVWQIVSRQVLGAPASWTDEGARLTFVWLGLFAAAFVFGERGHIAVEFVARKLPGRSERALAVVVQLITLAFTVVVLIWGGGRAASNAWLQNLSALPFTLGQMYLALPVAGTLIAFYSLYYVAGLLRGTHGPYVELEDESEVVAATVEPLTPRKEA